MKVRELLTVRFLLAAMLSVLLPLLVIARPLMVAKLPAPAPVTDHWASFKARSPVEALPIVIVPAFVPVPMLVALLPEVLTLVAPVTVNPVNVPREVKEEPVTPVPKVVEERTAEQIAGIHDISERYVKNAQRYQQTLKKIAQLYEGREYAKALRSIMELADKVNSFVDENKPWEIAKSTDREAELQPVIWL